MFSILAVTTGLILHVADQPPTAPPTPPTSLVLIVCRGHVEPWSTPDEQANAEYTHAENWQWDYPDSKMLCKRSEIPMIDQDEGKPLNGGTVFSLHPNFADAAQCAAAGIQLENQWDRQNKGSAWRVWRVGCPTPVIDAESGLVLSYVLPDCGHFDTIVCEIDSTI